MKQVKLPILNEFEIKAVAQMTKEFKMKGRLLPDSALTTYFGKPAFHAYGNGNINPVNAGISTGDNLKTHNINPHSGANQPKTL